jgi:hypothetical protein
VAVAIVVLALATGCQSKAATVRGQLQQSFGAPFDTWTDARVERFGQRVCSHFRSNPQLSIASRPAAWEHYFAPDVLQVFRDGYCHS